MSQEQILILIFGAVVTGVGFVFKRTLNQFDGLHKDAAVRMDDLETDLNDKNKAVCDRVLVIEQKHTSQRIAIENIDKKVEKFADSFAKSQSEIIQKLNQLVTNQQLDELKANFKELAAQINKFLISQGETNIRMSNYEKAQDELFRIINNINNKNNKGE